MQIFIYPKRSWEFTEYKQAYFNLISWIKDSPFAGVLVFTSANDAFDAFLLASKIAIETKKTPLIAVNPIYEHPFSLARKIASFYELTNQNLAINWVTGIAKSDLELVNDYSNKEQRYKRLKEYIYVVNYLLYESKPLHFSREYYTINGAVLQGDRSVISSPLQFVSGSSSQAIAIANEFNISLLNMLNFNEKKPNSVSNAVAFGLVVRETFEEAKKAYDILLPETRKSKLIFELSKQNTDSKWKEELNNDSSTKTIEGLNSNSVLRGADLPYIVCGVEYLIKLIDNLKPKTLVIGVNDNNSINILTDVFKTL